MSDKFYIQILFWRWCGRPDSALVRVTSAKGAWDTRSFWYSIPWKHECYFELYLVVRYVRMLGQ